LHEYEKEEGNQSLGSQVNKKIISQMQFIPLPHKYIKEKDGNERNGKEYLVLVKKEFIRKNKILATPVAQSIKQKDAKTWTLSIYEFH
jgi:hypothetical protein